MLNKHKLIEISLKGAFFLIGVIIICIFFKPSKEPYQLRTDTLEGFGFSYHLFDPNTGNIWTGNSKTNIWTLGQYFEKDEPLEPPLR